MTPNVFITGWKDGEVIVRHEGHNIWLPTGREYISRMLGYANTTLNVPFISERIHYLGFGIGGDKQSQLGISGAPPLSVDYPAGSDPNATTGQEQRIEYPLDPPISTLERPVRISGGTNPYGTAAPTDLWLKDIVGGTLLEMNMTGRVNAVFRTVIDTGAGDMLYGPYVQMPLSEVGLFLSTSDENDPFNVVVPPPPPPLIPQDTRIGTMVAYHAFDTILIVPGATYEFVWKVEL
jgi:hypothetical protein